MTHQPEEVVNIIRGDVVWREMQEIDAILEQLGKCSIESIKSGFKRYLTKRETN